MKHFQWVREISARNIQEFCGDAHRQHRPSAEGRLVLGVRHGCATAAVNMLPLVQRPPLREQRQGGGDAGRHCSRVSIVMNTKFKHKKVTL